MMTLSQDDLKRAVAQAAIAYVPADCIVGVGTGSSCRMLISAWAASFLPSPVKPPRAWMAVTCTTCPPLLVAGLVASLMSGCRPSLSLASPSAAAASMKTEEHSRSERARS